MRNLKGYLSFILFMQWAYVLLLPLHMAAPRPESLAGAYLAEETLADHVAFKRALGAAAREAVEEFRATMRREDAVLEGAGGPGVRVVAREADAAQRRRYLQGLVLRRWEQLERGWARGSRFDERVRCERGGARTEMAGCAERLSLREDGAGGYAAFIENTPEGRFVVETRQRQGWAGMEGGLRRQEVG